MREENQSLLYFAYGEHMNESEMLRAFPHARMVGFSRLEGYSLCFIGRDSTARAAVQASEKDTVPGRVWSLYASDADALDRVADAPYFARREVRSFCIEDMTLPALVYITVPGQQQGRPGFVSYDLLREAYETAGLDPQELREQAMQSLP